MSSNCANLGVYYNCQGQNCFGERYSRYECPRCGNAREEALMRVEAQAIRQAA